VAKPRSLRMARLERITDRLPQKQARNRGRGRPFGKPGAGQSGVDPAALSPGLLLVSVLLPTRFPACLLLSLVPVVRRGVLRKPPRRPAGSSRRGEHAGVVRSHEPGRPRERSDARGVTPGSILAGPGGAALAVQRAPQ
jgi:hypothetical protein